MKNYQTYIKKLSMIIVLSLSVSLVSSPLIVLASNEDSLKPVMTFDENGDIHLNISGENIVYTVRQVLVWSFSQVGAIIKDHDFEQFLKNDESYLDFWNEDNISVDNDGNIVLSDALVAYLKDMVLQYQIETSGYIYYPTISCKDIPATLYPSKTAYDTVQNLCEAHGLVAFLGKSSYSRLYFHPFSSAELSENSFVWENTYDSFLEADSTVKEAFLTVYDNETWDQVLLDKYYYDDYLNNAITADGNYNIIAQPFYYFTPINVTYELFNGYVTNTNGVRKASLLSSDGRKIKIYMGLDSFKNNTAGTRSVYLTEQFYDDTITSLAINFKSLAKFQESYYKEMLKAINASGLTDKQYTDLLEALHDIEKAEGMSEDKLAGILQQFVDQIADALENGSGGGSESGGSSVDVSAIESSLESILDAISGISPADVSGIESLLESIYASIESWGASIEAMLEQISLQVGDLSSQLSGMTEEEFTGKMDSATSQLFDAFSESGEILKTKFPFCIPWDIHSLLVKLGGSGIPQQASLYSLDDRPASGVWNPTPTGRPVEQWVSSAEEEKTEAPKFEIPFVIESAGISDTLVIDLQYFNAVSKVSRVMFTLVFCGVLIRLTFPVVGFINEFINGN